MQTCCNFAERFHNITTKFQQFRNVAVTLCPRWDFKQKLIYNKCYAKTSKFWQIGQRKEIARNDNAEQ